MPIPSSPLPNVGPPGDPNALSFTEDPKLVSCLEELQDILRALDTTNVSLEQSWTIVPLLRATWTPTSGFGSLEAYRDPLGFVHCRGQASPDIGFSNAQSAGFVTAALITQFPPDLRPAQPVAFPLWKSVTSGFDYVNCVIDSAASTLGGTPGGMYAYTSGGLPGGAIVDFSSVPAFYASP